MLPFAFSIFTGAFLLFAVQPLIGKYILPWFGGGPGVWTTCLLFFQTLLLGGYAYAHFSATRLTPRRQAIVHLVLLAAALALLPIIPADHWKPHPGDDPVWRILVLLTATLGLPYFVLSATGPLLQQWFSRTQPGVSPYRLYALSNAGSLLALLAYPFYFERRFSRPMQATLWSAGLVVFVAGCAWCAWRLWRTKPAAGPSAGSPTAAAETPAPTAVPAPSPMDRFLWFSLAGVASILLLATTNKLCQDLAVMPFLWVLPLSLYLISFILCFDHPRWYSPGVFAALFAVGAMVDGYLLLAGHGAQLAQQITGYAGTLFVGCMLCHGEVFRLRPAAAWLTSFYLFIAAGGAAGALFVAVVAPHVFNDYFELQLGLWLLSYLLGVLAYVRRSRALAIGAGIGTLAATIVLPALKATAKRGTGSFAEFWTQLATFQRENYWILLLLVGVFLLGFLSRRGFVREWQPRMAGFVFTLSCGLGVFFIIQIGRDEREATLLTRNFYGVLKVIDYQAADPDLHYTTLVNGVTSHGMQFASYPQSRWPTTYYGETSGVGLAIDHLPAASGRRLGLVGLGAGTVSTYGREGDTVRIYEINPEVEHIARTHFSYLAHTRAKVEVVLGDARLSMERELANHQPQQFDVLALDAFSSDAIPVHLLTREAFAVYLQHLKPDGVIAVHTSNRYLNLRPIVEELAHYFGLQAATISDSPPEKHWWVYRTTWVLVTRNLDLLDAEDIRAATEPPVASPRHIPLWTDDHTSVVEVLK